MKEFVEKLIGRLEEYKKQWMDADYLDGIDEIIEIVNELAEKYKNESVKWDLISRSALIKTLNEYVTKAYDCGGIDDKNVIEYQQTHNDKSGYIVQGFNEVYELLQGIATYNNDWIPCSERLPEISNSYLVTKKYENNGNPIYETAHEVFWLSDKKWDCERDEDCEWKVTAWQNKIEPYKKELEEI